LRKASWSESSAVKSAVASRSSAAKRAGIAIGEQRGEERGRVAERRANALRLFKRRFKSFNSAHEAVLLNLAPDQLERLLDDLFTFEHPDELFSLADHDER
jgi:hypothetical protein